MNKNINLGLAIVCSLVLLGCVAFALAMEEGKLSLSIGGMAYLLLCIVVTGLAVWANSWAYIVKKREERTRENEA